MNKQKAIIIKCSHDEISEIDNCLICAPFWTYYPICPIHKTKLNIKGFCNNTQCKKHYDISELTNDKH
jgi:hypothetical protein